MIRHMRVIRAGMGVLKVLGGHLNERTALNGRLQDRPGSQVPAISCYGRGGLIWESCICITTGTVKGGGISRQNASMAPVSGWARWSGWSGLGPQGWFMRRQRSVTANRLHIRVWFTLCSFGAGRQTWVMATETVHRRPPASGSVLRDSWVPGNMQSKVLLSKVTIVIRRPWLSVSLFHASVLVYFTCPMCPAMVITLLSAA